MELPTQEQIQSRFQTLPAVVQDAVTHTDIPAILRELHESSSMHLDKWDALYRIVMGAVVGLIPTRTLAEQLTNHLQLDTESVSTLVAQLAGTVFEPVRAQLERDLGHPEAKEEEVSDVEKVREAVLAEEKPAAPPAPIGTPPPPKPDAKVVRGPASGAYVPGEASTARKNVIDDPYREPLA